MATKGLLNDREKELILYFYKPICPSELIKISGINSKSFNYMLKRLYDKNIVKCFNSQSKTGRIYGLTEKGKELRTSLIGSQEASGIFRKEYADPKGLNWDIYGWITAGRGKREYLKIMFQCPKSRDGTFKASQIFTKFRYEGIKSTPRTEVYRAIKDFVKKGILNKSYIGKRNVRFMLTKQGYLLGELLST